MPGDSSPTVQQLPTMTPAQERLLNKITETITRQVGRGVTPYGGTTWAPQSELQTGAFDLVKDLLGGGGPMPQIEAGLGSLMQPWDPTKARAWWEEAIKAPALESWESDIVPGILEQFAAVDAAGGGGARTALADAGAKLETGLGASLANALLQGEQQSNEALLRAAGLSAQIPMQLGQLGATMGGMERGIESERLYEPYSKWLMSQPWANPWLQYLFPSLQVRPFENLVTPGTEGFWPGMLMGTGSLLGGISGFF